MDAQRPAGALDLELAQVGEREVALDERRRVLGEVGLAGLGELLHALRQADRVADRGVVHGQVLADRAHDHLAGVEAHADREAEPLLAAELRRVGGELLLQVKRRVAGALGVVLVGDRGAEQRHDAVAGELVDRALEAVDALAEDREEALHDLPPLLGVASLGELHRAHHVGEQHRHLLALALQGALAGADLLGEVLGDVEARSGGAAGPPIAAAPLRAVSSWPQALQNFWPAGFEAPQLGHGDAPVSAVAQLPQNRASDGLG